MQDYAPVLNQNYAPVVNQGYYDIPIHNSLSNVEIRDPVKNMDQYNFNKNINTTINDNNMSIDVKSHPTVPSASLYYETDQPMSSYYKPRLIKKKEYTVEQFSNDMHNYLNVQSIPNASSAYVPNYSYYTPLNTLPDTIQHNNMMALPNEFVPPQQSIQQSIQQGQPQQLNKQKCIQRLNKYDQEVVQQQKQIHLPRKSAQEIEQNYRKKNGNSLEEESLKRKDSKKFKSSRREVDKSNSSRENPTTMNYICIILVLLIILLIIYILYLHKNMK